MDLEGGGATSASVDLIFDSVPNALKPVVHSISFEATAQGFELTDERIEETEKRFVSETGVYFYYRFQDGKPTLNTSQGQRRNLVRELIEQDRSILAQRRDPETYPELAWLAAQYEQVRIYRDWTFGPAAPLRRPQSADMRNAPLEEDFSNLALFLNRMQARSPKSKRELLHTLRNLYEGISDIFTNTEGNTILSYLTEGDYSIPSSRLSDGTLRYLSLLAIIFDPTPPPLVCIEEPELGLHPDIVPGLADAIKSFSTKTQVVITTHSETLVNAMTDTPEAVIVCTKESGMTKMERLNQDDLNHWLEKYRLGELWTKGHLGGNRW